MPPYHQITEAPLGSLEVSTRALRLCGAMFETRRYQATRKISWGEFGDFIAISWGTSEDFAELGVDFDVDLLRVSCDFHGILMGNMVGMEPAMTKCSYFFLT